MDVASQIKKAVANNAESLDLSRQGITDLPPEIGGFRGKSLDLSSNQLKTLPREIGRLVNLTGLYLRGNPGIRLPAVIGDLSGLEWLDLAETELAELPPDLFRLERLACLDLSGNRMTRLPEEITRLVNLRMLYLDGNQLSELPRYIADLPNLRDLPAGGNLFVTPPPEIVREGVALIRNYYRQAEEQGFDYHYEAKLIIVGEPGAGKTTLSKMIVDPAYEPGPEGTTHGIGIGRWQFVHEGKPFYVNIWDFGGQAIYHATHRFFLTESSCYVLVAQERREDTDFHYWLQIVQLLGNGSPMIILRNVVDGRKKEIPRELLGRFNCYKDIRTIDLLHERDRFEDEVVRPLRFYLSGLKHIKNKLPKSWTLVRTALEEDNRDHISYGEFEQVCRNNRFTRDSDIKDLCRYFHNIGVCLHYAGDPLLSKLVILNPEWGTNAVYSILKGENIVNNNGHFTADDVLDVLEPKYLRMHYEIIELMAMFELIYQVPDTEMFIAPQLLQVNKPTYPWASSDDRMLRYTFPGFMPRGLLWRFIVAMHPFIEGHDIVWRGGVVLSDDGGRAEVVEDYPREIRVLASGANKRDLITRVHHEFRKIFGTYKNLAYNAEIACNCEQCLESSVPHYFKYDFLRRASGAGVSVTCEASLSQVDPRRLIEDVFDEHAAQRASGDGPDADKPSVNVNVTVTQNAVQQVSNQVALVLDFDKLTQQLRDVREHVRKLPESDEKDKAVGKLAEADEAAKKKDGPKVIEYLKSAGSVALDVAKSVAADVIVKLIEHGQGIG